MSTQPNGVQVSTSDANVPVVDPPRLNRVRGMLMGAFLGDALGAPHEFYCNRGIPYTGKLEHQAFKINRYTGEKTSLKVGQVTDDSEMTIILLRSLIRWQGYNTEATVRDYMSWAVHAPFLGTNTRELFREAGTRKDPIAAYKRKLAVVMAKPEEERSKSNGALMRCSPLALLSSPYAVHLDAGLTNPQSAVVACNQLYVLALRWALEDHPSSFIFDSLEIHATHPEVREVYLAVRQGGKRDLGPPSKGFCMHGLWCALTILYRFTTIREDSHMMYRWVIAGHPGSDTDTNACIAGALMGALLGYDRLYQQQQENIDIVIGLNPDAHPTPRPHEYTPHDFYQLSWQAAQLMASQQ